MTRSAARAKGKRIKAVIQFIAGVTALLLATKDLIHEIKNAVKPLTDGAKIGLVNESN